PALSTLSLHDALPISSANVDIIEEKPYQEIRMDFHLMPFRAGQNIVLNNLFFVAGSAEMVMKSYAELRKMVAIVKQYPNMKFTIDRKSTRLNSSHVKI